MSQLFPNGAYTVVVTPFARDGLIDYTDLGKLIDQQLKTDITGLVFLGTTSESSTISLEEKKRIIQFAHSRISRKKFIVIGVGGNDTNATTELAQYSSNYCDGIMVTVPNYNKPSQDGIFYHFQHISSNIDKPIMMYNIPSRTGVNMEPETIFTIYNTCKNIVAIKEASGSLNQVQDIINLCNIQIFSGDDALIIPIMAVGGSGVISVASNVVPNEIIDIVSMCAKNNYKGACKLQNNVREFIKYLFVDTNPTPIKELLYYNKTFKTNIMRLPLIPMQNIDQKQKLHALYSSITQNIKSYEHA